MGELKKVDLKFFDQNSSSSSSGGGKKSGPSNEEVAATGRAIYSAFVSAWFLMLVIGSPDWNYWRSLGATATAIMLARGMVAIRDSISDGD